jgi:hypothetical protein
MDREAILKVLQKRASVARERHQEAAVRFKEILADYPSAIPTPTVRHVSRMQVIAIGELLRSFWVGSEPNGRVFGLRCYPG